MIKNSMIALLILAVAGLYWMTLSDSDSKQATIIEFKQKVDDLKRQISKAYKATSKKTLPDVITTTLKPGQIGQQEIYEPENPDIIRDKNSAGELKDKDVDTGLNKTRIAGKSTAEILSVVKRKPKQKNNIFSREELNSILSLLKSASNTLRKTSFKVRQVEKAVPSENKTPDTAIIKKKSSAGHEELG